MSDAFIPSHVLILGHSGFVGRRLFDHLTVKYPSASVHGLSSRELDLTSSDSAARLAEHLRPETVVLFAAGIKSNYGSNLDTYARNIAIGSSLCRALALRTVRQVVFLSSVAVYGVDTHDRRITESTPVIPDTHYGLAKYATEALLRLQLPDGGPTALTILRISSVYGPHEKIIAPTPSGFLTTCEHGGEVTLWGDGSEVREFLFVDDLARVTDRLITRTYRGTLNVSSGSPASYRESLDMIGRLLGRRVVIREKPRTKPQVDKIYDLSRLRETVPDLPLTPLEDGLRLVHLAQRASSTRE